MLPPDYATQRAIDAPDRARRERRLEHVRELRPDRVHQRTWTRLLARLRPDHGLTPYPCRLPSGELGRTAVRLIDGEWVAVCMPARGMPSGSFGPLDALRALTKLLPALSGQNTQ